MFLILMCPHKLYYDCICSTNALYYDFDLSHIDFDNCILILHINNYFFKLTQEDQLSSIHNLCCIYVITNHW